MLQVGLLWRIDDEDLDQPFEKKLDKAVRHYTARYNIGPPNTCQVWLECEEVAAGTVIGGITIEKSKLVMPNHLFIGLRQV